MPSNKETGDKYEDACANIVRSLRYGGELLLEYCRVPKRHRIVLPTDVQQKQEILGGRSERLIETDVTFKFIDEKTRRVTPVIVECKYHKNSVDTNVFNTFAYNLLDIRANPDFKDSVGIMFAKSGFQDGVKLVAKNELIGIAVFDHQIKGSRTAFITEDIGLSLATRNQDFKGTAKEPDFDFSGALAFRDIRCNFDNVLQFLNQFGYGIFD